MNKQEIFNKVWKHFIVEKNPRSTDPNTKLCMYRGPNNTKCAVGLLIEDKDYTERMEHHSVDYILENYNIPGINQETIKFLEELQDWHDNLRADSSRLKSIAYAYELTIPE